MTTPDKEKALGDVLSSLYDVIQSRKGTDQSTSYTASLLQAGVERCAQKFGEEAVETIIAASGGDKQGLTEEAADALYHLLVLLAAVDISPDEVAAALGAREGTSGHAEKASRGDG